MKTVRRPGWDAASAAVIVCDMWDAHHCVTAARRVAEMAPRVNAVVTGLRERGAVIIHAPGGCMDFYRDTPARVRALQAPYCEAPSPIDWNDWEVDEKSSLARVLGEAAGALQGSDRLLPPRSAEPRLGHRTGSCARRTAVVPYDDQRPARGRGTVSVQWCGRAT